MPHLHATIAALPDIRSRAESTIAKVYQGFRKAGGFSGQSRTYQPLDDEGIQQAPQNQRVQAHVQTELEKLHDDLDAWFSAVLTQEVGNTIAAADIVVNGLVILTNVPVTFMLFLERQLGELKEVLGTIPTLNPEDTWDWDAGHGCYATPPALTYSTQKTPKGIILAPATKEHPAQVHLHTEERPVGTWSTIKLSGAISVPDKDALVRRVDALRIAVKTAREAANSVDVLPAHADALFGYLFDGAV